MGKSGCLALNGLGLVDSLSEGVGMHRGGQMGVHYLERLDLG
jgi:hypothetical protein